jgi:hypothetical protein
VVKYKAVPVGVCALKGACSVDKYNLTVVAATYRNICVYCRPVLLQMRSGYTELLQCRKFISYTCSIALDTDS